MTGGIMADYSPDLALAWRIAAIETAHARHPFIEKEHMLIGICSLEKVLVPGGPGEGIDSMVRDTLEEESEIVRDILGEFELDPTRLRRAVREALGKGTHRHTEQVIHRSEDCKAYFRRAEELAESTGEGEVRCLHLLAAIMEQPGELIPEVLANLGVEVETLKEKLFREVEAKPAEKPPGEDQELRPQRKPGEPERKKRRAAPYLDRYGRDITREAREGRLEPVVGRKKEILALVRALSRRTKNNPVLIGDPGVGKTAIVEGLAQRIVRGDVVEAIRDKRIVELNMGALVAGAMYRGQFEERLQGCLEEARNNPDIILFIDEIHTVVGAGRAEGSMDAAHILKPALGRGEIRCIGATTIDEYRRYIEKDSALERRFQPILVNEPTVAQTKEILRQIKSRYEEHHNVIITDEAVEAAVELSARYIPDRRFPDKAIDLLDEACSRARIARVSVPPEVKGAEEGPREVTREAVAEVISERTGIPIARLTEPERQRLQRMAEELKARVIGQDEAVEAVTQAIQRSRLMIRDPHRPIGVFFFAGPTGVGKTHLAKCLADFLFGSEKALIRLDLSEYQEKHTVSRLIGAPPGYVGYEEEGQLTGALRTRPFSVVLMDEVEKAHPDVLNLFLQVFEDGRLTDAKGRTVDATNAIFIMTSNIQLEIERPIGFRTRGSEEEALREALVKGGLRREFVQRIDRVVLFHRLSLEDVEKIARLFIEELQERLKGISLEVKPEALQLLAKRGYDEENGVRPLRRIIEREIEGALTEMILGGEVEEKDSVVITAKEDQIVLETRRDTT